MDIETPVITQSIQKNVSNASNVIGDAFGDRKKRAGTIILLLILVIFWVWVTNPMVVTVTGTGEVEAPATHATISFTLQDSDSSNPQRAISNVNAKALAMRTFLAGKGIASTDIAESEVTAVPAGLVTTGAGGYQSTIQMAAKTTKVAEISTLVSSLYAQGAYVVSQPVLSVENQSKLDQKAFDLAMKDAKSQAFTLGIKNLKILKKIIAISQETSSPTSTSTIKSTENGVFKIVKVVSISYKMW